MLNDGEDLPDSFILKAPLPTSITVKSLNDTTASIKSETNSSTLIVVAPKLSFLFDKVAGPVTQVGSLQVRFDLSPVAQALNNADDDDNVDETKRYFDYDAPDRAPEQSADTLASSASAKSLLEIPIFRTSKSTLTLRLPILSPSVSYPIALAIVNKLVLSNGLPGHAISNVLVLAPCEMSVGAPAIASLHTSASTSASSVAPTLAQISLLQPPHCIQGGPASVLAACESRNIPATALAIRAEGPVGHELVDRDTAPSLVNILNTAFKLSLSTKTFQQGSSMYI